MAQFHKDNSRVQPFKSYDMMRGHQMQVRDRIQPYLLSAYGKRNLHLGDNKGEKQNPVLKQRLLCETPVSFLVPMGSRCSTEVFNFEKINPVENKRRSLLIFKLNWFDHVSSNKGELRNSDWTRIGLTIEVNGEGKRRVAWKKRGLRSSIWVSRGQRQHVVGLSGSRVHTLPLVGSDQQVGLTMIPFTEPTGPSRLVVGVSPNEGDKRPLIQEAHSPARSKASHKALVAQDDRGVVGYHVEVSPVPLEKAGTARQLASMTVMYLVGQTKMNWFLAKASMEF